MARSGVAVAHHVVPKFLIKNFCTTNGLAFSQERGEGIRPKPPKKLLVVENWHRQIEADGTPDVSAEAIINRSIENSAARIVRKIIRAANEDNIPQLSARERAAWDRFFVLQRIRTPDHFRLSATFDGVGGDVERFLLNRARTGRIVPAELASRLRSKSNVERLTHNLRIQLYLRPLKVALDAIATRGLGIVKLLDEAAEFILGSNPVIKLCPPETNDVRDGRVEMWLPVSPKVLVGLGGARGTETIVGWHGRGVADTINEVIASQSSTVVARSVAVIERLIATTGGATASD